ncbi:CIC11C00000002550 [Sungouiella intermedia]|uniref:CIC11C00000002550 n=1 Tax=Sungouiella intermedia TaxID=45354 RepID=A0A1L0GR94_9ASCO|nr:CIC11C00000002550 [[Candida] intermedia]
MKLRIACVQFSPTLGKIEANIAKVNKLLSGVKKDIDLLVLPELSLTGYNFASPNEINPYLEVAHSGPTFNLASELSSKFRCTTIIGYPEKFQNTTYNSAMVVNESGQLIYNYRKTHLYETDENWGCSENPEKNFRR